MTTNMEQATTPNVGPSSASYVTPSRLAAMLSRAETQTTKHTSATAAEEKDSDSGPRK